METLPPELLHQILDPLECWQKVQFVRLNKRIYHKLKMLPWVVTAKEEHDKRFGTFENCHNPLRDACKSGYRDKIREYAVRYNSCAIPNMVASCGHWDFFLMLVIEFPKIFWWDSIYGTLIHKGKLEGVVIAVTYGGRCPIEGLRIALEAPEKNESVINYLISCIGDTVTEVCQVQGIQGAHCMQGTTSKIVIKT